MPYGKIQLASGGDFLTPPFFKALLLLFVMRYGAENKICDTNKNATTSVASVGNSYAIHLYGVADESRYKPHPTRPQTVVANPTCWHLLCLDTATGQIVQQVSLGDELLDECRIEDVDEHGLLIGKSNNELVYFRRISPNILESSSGSA